MANIVLVGALPESLINFRGDLLDALVLAGHQVAAMAADTSSEVLTQLEEKGVNFCGYSVQRNGLSPSKDLDTLLALARQFRRLDPDIVLSYTIKAVIWSGIALMAKRRTRFFALITGLGYAFQDNAGWKRKVITGLASFLYWMALSRAEKVIFQNYDDLDVFVSKHIVKRSKCDVVNGSGVNLLRFREILPPKRGIVILTIGRLLGEKGFREYAQAARLVKAQYPEVIFQLIGSFDSSPNGINAEELEFWQKQGWVDYLGSVRDVRPYLQNCHIFVLPSFYREGLPRTIIEAMAIGRPILTTDNVGCRETVIPGENGYLVPKANAAALAERMIWFIENRDQWGRMGKRSRELVEEKFDVHKVNAQLMEIMKL